MNYSNGFDTDLILPAFTGRLGWASDAAAKVRFESFHALLTESNLRAVQPNAALTDEQFATYRQSLTQDIVLKALRNVFSDLDLIEQVLLHTRIANTATTAVTGTGKFVGIAFSITPSFSIASIIKSVRLLFDGDAAFNLYLFKEGTPAAVKTLPVTVQAGVPAVIETDFLLPFDGTTRYYLGYFQDDLGTAKAIREQVCFTDTQHFVASFCQMQKTSANTVSYEAVGLSYDGCGINAEVHTFRDYTRKIIRSVSQFDELIGLYMQYHVLEMITSTVRSNERQRILADAMNVMELKHYLYGTVAISGVAKGSGLNDLLRQKTEAVRRAFFPKPKMRIASC